MKLNILSKSLLAAGLLAMVACSDDAPITAGSEPSNGSGSDGDGYYMTVNVQLPSPGSRSQTTDEGWGDSDATPDTEIGFDYENDVNDILIVLADATDNSFITAGSVAGAKLNPVPAQNAYRPIAKLDKTSLGEFYDNNSSRTINVFVFCNPTKDLVTYINGLTQDKKNTEWVNYTCQVLEGNGQTPTNVGIWGQNGFLMSNKQICTRQIPADFDDWKKFNTEAKAFNLSGVNDLGDDKTINNNGAVEVERSVARFDFRDGSKLGNNTYNVIHTLDETGKQIPLFNVQLDRMMLTNEAKDFYYLPRVSEKGQLANSILCGSENSENYVVGPYAAISNKEFEGDFSTYFNYPFFNNQNKVDYTQWTTTYLNDVIGKTEDNLSDTQLADQYYVWRYVTENVIPADNNNQKMGRTTMVVFKGRLVPAEAAFTSEDANVKAIADAIGNGTTEHPGNLDKENLDNNPAIYYFNNLAYFGWDNIKKAAIESALQFQTITVTVDGKTEERVVPTYETIKDENGETIKDENGEDKKFLTGVRHSSSLYIAVFGDGCMGKITWGETTYYDEPEGMSVDKKSTNYLYDQYEIARDDDSIDTDKALANFKEAVTGQQITIYESSNDSKDGVGYYFYYYYKNRHNDNLDNGTMGAMEFATVRNNVYKLAVTNIKSLGHPRIPENDPDAPEPGTPDESDDLYITVTCKVMPWIVRINNIEF